MKGSTADIVICGAGIAGVSAAYHLAVRHRVKNIVLIDERPPLTLTSDKGTQAYRNWWPGPDDTMVRFMNRGIDLLEELADECGNLFDLNRRGYVFLTADTRNAAELERHAQAVSAFGAGPVRVHKGLEDYPPSPPRGFQGQPTGADIVLDAATILRHFPFITEDVVAMTHVRRCGWLDSMRLGGWLLENAEAHGVRLVRDRVEAVRTVGGRVQTILLQSGGLLDASNLVIAAGPLLKQVGAMLGLDVPVVNELHGKITFRDSLGVVPCSAPMMIWNDTVRLKWTDSERVNLKAREDSTFLLDEFPAGVHFRPRGNGERCELLLIWTYETKSWEEPVWPPVYPRYYAQVCLRGLSRMIPGLSAYFGHESEGVVDGGYYCKARDNRPVIGPLPVEGAHAIAALSGYGVMASQAAAELLAAHIVGGPLPNYADAFLFARFDDPEYQTMLKRLDALSGQL